MKFKITDKVRIRKGTRYYGTYPIYSPADTVGTVSGTSSYGRLIEVEWPGGCFNHFRPSDLELDEEILLEI